MNNNQKQSDTLGWLTTVLPNDSNFVSALNRAREAELEEATEIMSPKAGSKTCIMTIQRAPRKRQKNAKAQEPVA